MHSTFVMIFIDPILCFWSKSWTLIESPFFMLTRLGDATNVRNDASFTVYRNFHFAVSTITILYHSSY
jgi:hypothetical protein